MKKKQTYEELEFKIKELEYFLGSYGKKTEGKMYKFFNFSVDMLCIADMKGFFKIVNDSFEKTLGYSKAELYEQPYTAFVHPDDLCATMLVNDQLLTGESIISFENRYRCKDGSYKWLAWTSRPIVSEGINYAVARDISNIKKIEKSLMQAHDDLEQRIEERTTELNAKTQELKATNTQLKQKESALEDNNHNLNELNTALKVIINHKDDVQQEIEKKILVTINTLVKPYLTKLARISPDAKQQNIIKIINANLQEIISPFSHSLASEYINLTATEIQIADLIKNTHSNKEIAELMNLSPETVIGHRKNIRKKLGIAKTKTNLSVYLKSLA